LIEESDRTCPCGAGFLENSDLVDCTKKVYDLCLSGTTRAQNGECLTAWRIIKALTILLDTLYAWRIVKALTILMDTLYAWHIIKALTILYAIQLNLSM
jgi:hypothetical protein